MAFFQREDDEFERMRLVARMERDRGLIADYRENEKFSLTGSFSTPVGLDALTSD